MNSKYDRYRGIMCDVLSLNTADVEQATYKSSENWSSLTHLILIDRLEEEFDCMFTREEILSFQSYEKGLSILKTKGLLDS